MLYYEEYGDPNQETIVFLHGLATSSWIWWRQVDYFRHYHVILVDLPGHGKSENIEWVSLKDTCQRIKDDIVKDNKVHLVGISLGGHVALDFTKYFQENVLSTYISGITTRPMAGKMFMPLVKRYYVRELSKDANLQKLAREYRIPSNKFPAFKENAQKLTTDTVATLGLEIMRFNFDETYGHIKVSLKVVCGEKESPTIKETLNIIPEIIPHATLEQIPNVYHQWPMQKPDLFNQQIDSWITL